MRLKLHEETGRLMKREKVRDWMRLFKIKNGLASHKFAKSFIFMIRYYSQPFSEAFLVEALSEQMRVIVQ
jgi:hypothetical protein